MAWQRAEGVERLVRRPTLTAPARVGFCDAAGRDEETGFQIEQRNTLIKKARKQESKKARKQESKKARKRDRRSETA
jgi:hypothetical protein